MPGADRVAATTSKRPGSILRLRIGGMSMTDSENKRAAMSGCGRSGDFFHVGELSTNRCGVAGAMASQSQRGSMSWRQVGARTSSMALLRSAPARNNRRRIDNRRRRRAAFNGSAFVMYAVARPVAEDRILLRWRSQLLCFTTLTVDTQIEVDARCQKDREVDDHPGGQPQECGGDIGRDHALWLQPWTPAPVGDPQAR